MIRKSRINEIVALHVKSEGALLQILHDVQAEFGCIDEAAKSQISSQLNLTAAEVHGVASFYHDFKAQAATLPVVKLCGAEACQARGSEILAEKMKQTAAELCEIETVYCLGLCSVGPNAMINNNVHARLDDVKLAELIAGL